eukprot:TRINITY_DN12664_c0_g1_i1.p1 TRINITY_DN12664_c0_g1~~TRINITY_DN12664_c0_g1_i1.p1  ORF type:complete len:238 (-),score=39.76 TRINITY_DN12664_c0_g1_i1:129-842(-)
MWPLWILSKLALKVAVSFTSQVVVKTTFVIAAKTIQSRLFFLGVRWLARLGLKRTINFLLVTDRIRMLWSRRGLNLPRQSGIKSIFTSQAALANGPGGRRKLSVIRSITSSSEGLKNTADQLASFSRLRKWRKKLRELYMSVPLFPYYSEVYPGSLDRYMLRHKRFHTSQWRAAAESFDELENWEVLLVAEQLNIAQVPDLYNRRWNKIRQQRDLWRRNEEARIKREREECGDMYEM